MRVPASDEVFRDGASQCLNGVNDCVNILVFGHSQLQHGVALIGGVLVHCDEQESEQ